MTSLVQEVLALLHLFRPDPKFIKDKIERLIEREFLARDEQDKTMLLYVAWENDKSSLYDFMRAQILNCTEY